MAKEQKKQFWTPEQSGALREHVRRHAAHLKSKFYENIIAGSMQFRKAKGFFKELGRKVGKSSVKCKSKFQKREAVLYLRILGLPKAHYDLYCYIRKGFKLTGAGFQSRENQINFNDRLREGRNGLGREEGPPEQKSQFGARESRQSFFERLREKIIRRFVSGELESVDLGRHFKGFSYN